MNKQFIEILRCPVSGQPLTLVDIGSSEEKVYELATSDDSKRYPILNNIPRFVPQTNYADNFGMQWNHFAKTQLDSYSGQTISADRFWKATGWTPEQLKGKWVLDIGCGSGRFAEVALTAGAIVVALDYSSAADACYSNLSHFPNLHVVQGDVYALPFAAESFSFVYSLGVLQHTPDVEKAFLALPSMIKPGGHLCVDFYWRRFQTMMHLKYVLRPITKRMAKEKVFNFLKWYVPFIIPISNFLSGVPLMGKILQRITLIADYSKDYPLTKEQLKEWALLDTFDMLSPAYDNPQSLRTVKSWMSKTGLKQIDILHVDHLVARATKDISK